MSKLRSLAWIIHAGGYKTAESYARFTNTSPLCPRCNQVSESVVHALVECQEVDAFWSSLYRVLRLPHVSRPDTYAILTLHLAKEQRGQLNVNSCSLAIACGLWVVHRARIRRHFSQTQSSSSAQMLLAEWQWMVRDILIAKQRTAMERNTSRPFNRSWKWQN